MVTDTLGELMDTKSELLLFYNRKVTTGFDDGELVLIKSE